MKKSASKKDAAKREKMKAAKEKRTKDHKKRVAAIKDKTKAEIKKIKAKQAKKAEDAKDSSKAWDCNLRQKMYKHIRAESSRLVESGMSKKEALAAARKSSLGLHSVNPPSPLLPKPTFHPKYPIYLLVTTLIHLPPQGFQSTY